MASNGNGDGNGGLRLPCTVKLVWFIVAEIAALIIPAICLILEITTDFTLTWQWVWLYVLGFVAPVCAALGLTKYTDWIKRNGK